MPVPAADARADPAAAPPEPTGTAALAERVRGLEDKLRESAAARKAADQARMAAERRQAEAVQEALRVNAGMADLAAAKADLERRLAIIEEAAARTAGELDAARAQLQTLTAESEAQTRRETELRGQVARLETEFRAREAEAARQAEEAVRVQADLRTRLLTQETESARLAAEHRTLRAERDDFALRVRPLAEQLPETQGGTLTEAEAERRSAAAAAALREAIARTRDSGGTESREAVKKAEETLRRWQFATALVTGAQGLYRVRPADTLPQIAGRVYGNTARWRTIRDANRQVLPDQGRPTPGLTLVIP